MELCIRMRFELIYFEQPSKVLVRQSLVHTDGRDTVEWRDLELPCLNNINIDIEVINNYVRLTQQLFK